MCVFFYRHSLNFKKSVSLFPSLVNDLKKKQYTKDILVVSILLQPSMWNKSLTE